MNEYLNRHTVEDVLERWHGTIEIGGKQYFHENGQYFVSGIIKNYWDIGKHRKFKSAFYNLEECLDEIFVMCDEDWSKVKCVLKLMN